MVRALNDNNNSFVAADRSAERVRSGNSPVFTGGDSVRPERPCRSDAISDARHFGRWEQDGSMGDRSQFSE